MIFHGEGKVEYPRLRLQSRLGDHWTFLWYWRAEPYLDARVTVDYLDDSMFASPSHQLGVLMWKGP